MTIIFKAAGAGEFLALVPHLLSYSPQRSLVLVPFAGKRTAGALRFDLPLTDDMDEIARVASTYIGLVCKISPADGVAAVVYTDDPFATEEGRPHDALMRAVLARADLCGLRVVDALCVAADGWGSYLDPVCPPEGRPLSEIPLDDQRLDDFPALDSDQSVGAALPAADLAEKERVARALLSLDRATALLLDEREPADSGVGEPADIDPGALAAACGLDDIPMLFEDALDWDAEHPDPFDIAVMAWCLSRPVFRDVALVQWSGDLADGDEALDAQLRWLRDRDTPAGHLGERMCGEGPVPDPDRLERALALVRRVSASAPREARPGPLATCAWLAWALGRSTHAAAYAESALQIDPAHGLSDIVMTLVGNARLPEWAFDAASARSAWAPDR